MDKRSSDLFLKLMRCYLCGEVLPDDLHPTTDSELEGVIAMAAQHQLIPILFDALGHSLPEFVRSEQWMSLRRNALLIISDQVQKRAAFARVYGELLSCGLRPPVVKGIITASLYPSPDCRISSDEDIFAGPSERDACAEALCRAGMIAGDDKTEVQLFVDPVSGLRIELHSALFPEYMASANRMNDWFADAFDRIIPVTIGEAAYYTLSPTDHMLYLICHAFKHFVHSGFGIRQVCDCMLYALAYVTEIDWDLIWGRLKEIHADVFLANLRVIAEEQFGCDFYSPIAHEYEGRIDTADLLADILDAGVYGGSRDERKQSSVITLQAANAASEDADEWAVRSNSGRRAALFPPLSTLKGRYSYLQKAPFLLPIAWVQRIWEYQKKRSRGEAASPDAILEIGRSRTRLLAKYGVIDE